MGIKIIIFEIEGIEKVDILKELGFTIENDFVLIENKKIPIDAVEMIVPGKNGKPKILVDPLEVSDFFAENEEE